MAADVTAAARTFTSTHLETSINQTTIDGAQSATSPVLRAEPVDTGEPVSAARRELLKGGAGLVLALTWVSGAGKRVSLAASKPDLAAASRSNPGRPFVPNAFVRIGNDGIVHLIMPFVEMGQGAYTGQATLLAEELGVELSQVRVEHAPADEHLYALESVGAQITGSSATIKSSWKVLREAGATAKAMLISAAAAHWGIRSEQCYVDRGRVCHARTQQSLTFGELANAAARQPPPRQIELVRSQSLRLIGKSEKRLDTVPKTDGSLKYSIDGHVPDMRVAAVEISPTLGGRLKRIDDRLARQIPGVSDVVALHDAVAVTANDFWTARKALKALALDWDAGPHSTLSTHTVTADLAALALTGKALVAKEVGAGTHATTRRVEASYVLPMLAHAALEPLSAIVSVRDDLCEIWAGTQVPARVVDVAGKITGLPAARIVVHNQYVGGSFGRRLETDFIEQAIQIARHVPYPIKLIWTREQDIALDYLRPPYHDQLVATLDDHGLPATWWHRVTSDTVTERWGPAYLRSDGLDGDCVDGATEPPYSLPHMRVEWVRHRLPAPVRIGWWRGVGQTHTLFPVECFMDELAHAAGQDPVAYRLSLLSANPRAKAVLQLAAGKFGWGRPVGPRVGCGVALGTPMGTYICAMLEVEVNREGEIRLRRAVAAVDCGTVVNPNTLTAQVEGGLLFGWSAALYNEITLQDGSIEQRNFNSYRVLRINEVPNIEVYTIQSTAEPTGIGEPPTAIAAPCLANAVFAATGIRVRQLPLSRQSLAVP